jgi:microcompartment protein CcmL/EutN
LGLLETTGFTPAMVALDVMHKAATIQVLQAEINDLLGIVIKITGSPDSVRAAIAAGESWARQMGGNPKSQIIDRADDRAWTTIESPREFNPLIQQDVVHYPNLEWLTGERQDEGPIVTETTFALGFIETQGFTAVFEAIDTACKAANVEVIGKEKLGGGYVTVIIKGDVAAVQAAIESGQQKVEGLGKLIAAHVIARPSASVLSLLPKS